MKDIVMLIFMFVVFITSSVYVVLDEINLYQYWVVIILILILLNVLQLNSKRGDK